MKGLQRNARGTYERGVNCQENAGECRGISGERTVVGAKCQRNAGECTGMQGNARETYGSECKVPGECR